MVDKEKSSCTCCKYEFLCVKKRRVTRLMVSMLAIFFMVFSGGYYVGKRKAAQEFLDLAQQEFLIMQSPMTTALNNYNQAFEQRKELAQLPNKEGQETTGSPESNPHTGANAVKSLAGESINQNWYQAQLAGFGSYKGALQCVQRLKKSGINTNIVKRMSKSARKTIYWYQVVSEKYIDKKELEDMLAEITRKEKLNDVKIVKVNHDSSERALT